MGLNILGGPPWGTGSPAGVDCGIAPSVAAPGGVGDTNLNAAWRSASDNVAGSPPLRRKSTISCVFIPDLPGETAEGAQASPPGSARKFHRGGVAARRG